jgi:hypothetical protein
MRGNLSLTNFIRAWDDHGQESFWVQNNWTFSAQPGPVQSPKKMHGPLGLVFSGLVGFPGPGYCDKPGRQATDSTTQAAATGAA